MHRRSASVQRLAQHVGPDHTANLILHDSCQEDPSKVTSIVLMQSTGVQNSDNLGRLSITALSMLQMYPGCRVIVLFGSYYTPMRFEGNGNDLLVASAAVFHAANIAPGLHRQCSPAEIHWAS